MDKKAEWIKQFKLSDKKFKRSLKRIKRSTVRRQLLERLLIPKTVKIKIQRTSALRRLGYSAHASSDTRRKALDKAVKQYGERSVLGMLQAQVVFRKRTDPELSEVFSDDRNYIAGTYKGKRKVGFPSGFSKKLAKKVFG